MSDPRRTTATGEPAPPLAVDERGSARVDAILRLIDEASRPRPLTEVLAALCAEVSTILESEIVSIYVRGRATESAEARETLRMVANVGFPAGAARNVRLRVGEGVTGYVAASLRPASLRLATADEHYKHFPGLGEENYPIFLAIPVLVGHRAEGVLVLQRKEGAFLDEEVTLAAALATSFAYALERARERRAEAEPTEEARVARLEGVGLSAGEALGRAETLPTFEGLAALERSAHGDEADASGGVVAQKRMQRVEEAHASLVRDLARVRRRLLPDTSDIVQQELAGLALLEEDGRLLESLVDAVASANLALGVRKVAREYAQALYRGGKDPSAWQAGRAEELEDFCLLVAARAVGARVPSGGAVVLLPERLSAVVVLAAVSHKAVAITVGTHVAPQSPALALAKAAGMPVVADVGGLFAWARAGDVVLVEGDVVRVSPSPTQIARFRQRDRDKG